MRHAKSYIDRDELIEFLKDLLIPADAQALKHEVTEYEYGYSTAILDILKEVECLL